MRDSFSVSVTPKVQSISLIERSTTELCNKQIVYRQEPGQIGWGVQNSNLIDKQPLTKVQIPKLHVRMWDRKEQRRFSFGTGYKRASFDKIYGIDPQVYQKLNLVGQRNTIKALDYRLKLRKIKPNFTLQPLTLPVEEAA